MFSWGGILDPSFITVFVVLLCRFHWLWSSSSPVPIVFNPCDTWDNAGYLWIIIIPFCLHFFIDVSIMLCSGNNHKYIHINKSLKLCSGNMSSYAQACGNYLQVLSTLSFQYKHQIFIFCFYNDGYGYRMVYLIG